MSGELENRLERFKTYALLPPHDSLRIKIEQEARSSPELLEQWNEALEEADALKRSLNTIRATPDAVSALYKLTAPPHKAANNFQYKLAGIAAVFLVVAPLWVMAFWYMRNPVFGKADVTTSHVNVDPARLEAHVRFLADLQPNRSFMNTESLAKAEKYIVDQFREIGFENVELQDVFADGKTYHNVIARTGEEKAKDLIVLGAHYDAAGENNPGADDNASGVAALLELQMQLWPKQTQLQRDLALVLARIDMAKPASMWLDSYLRSNPNDPEREELTDLLAKLSQ